MVICTKAFEEVKACADFADITSRRPGKYPQMTGDTASGALSSATDVPQSTKDFVTGWLKDRYGVSLK